MTNEKIGPSHLERGAWVYVRQSSMTQVRHNAESRRRQYGLAERAKALGFKSVTVVDDDLGRSGGGSQERPGFARLTAAVCEGRVGAVLALEASRLARNNRDWHYLIDLCALAETLVLDHDGVYDPRILNDRLLLGLKGTMSEFELGLIRQRAQEALREKIRRGEVLTAVPVGYVRTRDNRVEMTPDRQVQEAIRGVFAKFRELGSARQVLLWYRQEKVPLPAVHCGERGHEVVWRLPVYNRVLAVLKNPVYAGAFVHGRRETRTVLSDGRARKTSGHDVPRERWTVLIRDHHPGYITWDEYVRNQDALESNSAMGGRMKKGAPKSGPALLAGLLRCGRCGRKFHVGYSGVGGRVPRYFCRGAQINHGSDSCISFGGLRVDRAVSGAVLEALRPAGVEASLEAWDGALHRGDEKRKALGLALEKARYEADRARRQYDEVDPENRLVAAELEARWEAALGRAGEIETRLAEAAEPEDRPAEGERRRLLDLGEDLEGLWNHPEAPAALKKRVLRTVLNEIVANERTEGDLREIVLRLHWAGGVHTELVVQRNRTGHHGRSTDRDVVDLVRELAKVCADQETASVLNRLRHRTGQGNTWTQSRVAGLRKHNGIAPFDPASRHDWVTLQEAATALGISKHAVRRLLKQGVLPGGRWSHVRPG